MTRFILTPESCNIFCFGVCATDAKLVKPYDIMNVSLNILWLRYYF